MKTNATSAAELRITFLGGCSMIGFLVGKEDGFVAACTRSLQAAGINATSAAYPYINLKKGRDSVELCRLSRPDILVVQCAYLFNPNLTKKISRRLKPKQAAPPKPYDPFQDFSDFRMANTDATFTPSFGFRFMQHVRHLLHSLACYRFINKEECSRYMDAFFNTLKDAGYSNVVVLSTFPTTDKILNRYRKIGNELLYQKSIAFGFQFIDAFSLIQEQYGSKIFTIDDVHLNKEAHGFIGAELAERLMQHQLKTKACIPDVLP